METPASGLMTTGEAAEFLHLAPQTLNSWRCTRRVRLPFLKIGSRAVRYRLSDLERYLTGQTSPEGRSVNA